VALVFEWDPKKAAGNLAKHGISFEEASTIFGDPLEASMPDPDHSKHEDRWPSLGRSSIGNVLVLSYTERKKSLRLISARKATPKERRRYENVPKAKDKRNAR
jgi:uncharacterized DUF497 family protein